MSMQFDLFVWAFPTYQRDGRWGWGAKLRGEKARLFSTEHAALDNRQLVFNRKPL